jgi:hypothetical protein
MTTGRRDAAGTYAYDRASDRFLWVTSVNRGNGATQWLGEILPD